MKQRLSSLELHYLSQELQHLVGARLDKVYQGAKEQKDDLTLQLHKSGEGKQLLRILLPSLILLQQEKATYPKTPGYYAVFLRKHLGNARLTKIEQRNFERILELTFEKKEHISTLLIELIQPGNILLLNEAGKIINLLHPQRHGQRLLRGGALYAPPPAQFDTRSATDKELEEQLRRTNKDQVVKALAIDLGFGGTYAEEICNRAKIKKERIDLSAAELKRIVKSIRGIFKEKIVPSIISDEIFPIQLQESERSKEKSFSAAIEQSLEELPSAEEEKAAATITKAKDKTAEMLRKQEQMVKGFHKSAKENQERGELLYTHYQTVQQLLKDIATLRKKHSWKEVKEQLKGRIVKINETKGEVTIDL